MTESLKILQKIINVKFKDLDLLKASLIHKSYNNIENNEKLEFLGDRVLGLVLSEQLIKIYPEEKEGIIDKKFANLVNKKTCLLVAKKLNLKKYIITGDSNKGLRRSDDKILGDGLEALIGCIY
jgi:ribonuclease-3